MRQYYTRVQAVPCHTQLSYAFKVGRCNESTAIGYLLLTIWNLTINYLWFRVIWSKKVLSGYFQNSWKPLRMILFDAHQRWASLEQLMCYLVTVFSVLMQTDLRRQIREAHVTPLILISTLVQYFLEINVRNDQEIGV